jgi:iron complex outermembrane recepter protein
MRTSVCVALASGLLASGIACAAVAPLSELSLEELSNLEITSVSRRAERLADAPTAVFVITAEDIRRAGATSLPEALRLAPNLQVVRVYANGHTVSARGFASQAANKLLVLIDGRSVYSPLFSGVFWDVQHTPLEDIDRIEVISGPGGTLWGVNAVNGVINVITRSARQTQGLLAAAGGGNQEQRANVRYGAGGSAGPAWRLYASASHDESTETAAGVPVDDAGRFTQAGFRLDGDAGGGAYRVSGEIYAGRRGQPEPGTISIGEPVALGDITVRGSHLLASWQRRAAAGAWLVQGYIDRTERTVRPTFADRQQIIDLQVQYELAPLGAHRAVVGGELRRGDDEVDNEGDFAFLPPRVKQTWSSFYAQDEITLAPTLRLTLGARVERNSYTGTGVLPNVRLAWNPAPSQLVWAAASRTLRAPSRLDRDLFVPRQPPYLLQGGPDMQSEVAQQYEIGWRGQPSRDSSVSATLFRARHERLRTQALDPTATSVIFANGMEGVVRGAELWGSLQAAPNWRLHAGFGRLLQDLRLAPGGFDVTAPAIAEGANPGRWWQLRSAFDVTPQIELDAALRYVGALALPEVPAYHALDLRLGWRPRPDLELSLAAKNLGGSGHAEFADVSTRTQFGREWFARLTLRW